MSLSLLLSRGPLGLGKSKSSSVDARGSVITNHCKVITNYSARLLLLRKDGGSDIALLKQYKQY